MVIVMLPATALAASYTDVSGHWAQAAIEKWSDLGIIQGSDGNFRPNDYITRGEMAVVIDRVMQYKTKAPNVFSDLDSNFYTDAMLKANAAGVILGDGMTIRPSDNITREEAVVMLGRALGLTEKNASDASFTDSANISSWALGYVNAMAAKGYIHGSDGRVNAGAFITRAEIITILDNAIPEIMNKPKEYTGDVTGTVIVNTPGAMLKDLTITGDLIIAQGVGNGDVTLDNVTVTGNTIVRGGGPNSIHIEAGSQIGNLIVEKTSYGSIRVVTSGGAVVNSVYIYDGKDDIILSGSYGNITINADVNVTMENVDIAKLGVTASGASIEIGKGSKVGTLMASAQTSVTNDGEVTVLVADTNGVVFDGNAPGTVNVSSGVMTPPVDGKGNPLKPAAPSGGSSSGGSSSKLSQAAPTGLTGVAPTAYGGSDGSITGTTTAMEYKLSAASTYTTVTGTSITDLAAGTYNVRYASKAGYDASPDATVTVPDGPLTISTGALTGLTPPAGGTADSSAITNTSSYTAEVSWSPALVDVGETKTFAYGVAYTATVTLTPKEGFTLNGVTANAFTVAGATCTNAKDSGVVTVVFPETAAYIPTSSVDFTSALSNSLYEKIDVSSSFVGSNCIVINSDCAIPTGKTVIMNGFLSVSISKTLIVSDGATLSFGPNGQLGGPGVVDVKSGGIFDNETTTPEGQVTGSGIWDNINASNVLLNAGARYRLNNSLFMGPASANSPTFIQSSGVVKLYKGGTTLMSGSAVVVNRGDGYMPVGGGEIFTVANGAELDMAGHQAVKSGGSSAAATMIVETGAVVKNDYENQFTSGAGVYTADTDSEKMVITAVVATTETELTTALAGDVTRVLIPNSASMTEISGNITVSSGKTLVIQKRLYLTGSLTVETGGVLETDEMYIYGTLTNNGTVSAGNYMYVKSQGVSGCIHNAGTFTGKGVQIQVTNGLDNTGILSVKYLYVDEGCSISNINSLTIDLMGSQGMVSENHGTIANTGTFTVASGSSFTNYATFNNDSSLIINGTLNGTQGAVIKIGDAGTVTGISDISGTGTYNYNQDESKWVKQA